MLTRKEEVGATQIHRLGADVLDFDVLELFLVGVPQPDLLGVGGGG